MVVSSTRKSFEALVVAAFVDGNLADEERAVLRRKATEMDIPVGQFDEILDRGRKGQLRVFLPSSPEERLELLDSLIDVICADGRLDRTENRLLLRLGGHLKINASALGRRVRARLDRLRSQPRQKEQPLVPDVKITERSEPEPVPPPESPETIGSDSSLLQMPSGPVQLNAIGAFSDEIPPVTRGLVRSVILFEGTDAAVRYLVEKCGVEDESHARASVQNMIDADPNLKPPTAKITSITPIK